MSKTCRKEMEAFAAALNYYGELRLGPKWRTVLAKAIGMKPPTLSNISTGRSRGNLDNREKIAKFFTDGVDSFCREGEKLIHGEQPSLPKIKAVWLNVYRIIEGELFRVVGGKPMQQPIAAKEAPVGHSENAWYIIVPDNSMEPALKKGSHLLVDPDAELEDGLGCLAILPDGRVLIRRYRESRGKIILYSDTQGIEPMILNKSTRGLKIYRTPSFSSKF